MSKIMVNFLIKEEIDKIIQKEFIDTKRAKNRSDFFRKSAYETIRQARGENAETFLQNPIFAIKAEVQKTWVDERKEVIERNRSIFILEDFPAKVSKWVDKMNKKDYSTQQRSRIFQLLTEEAETFPEDYRYKHLKLIEDYKAGRLIPTGKGDEMKAYDVIEGRNEFDNMFGGQKE